MFDVIGSVVIHTVEIVTAFDECSFFGREFWETIAELFAHGGGVVAKVDRVGEPGDCKFDFAVAGFNIFWVAGIPRVCSIACFC